MCSINNRNKLSVYQYFIDQGEVNYIEAIRALKEQNVRLGAFGHGIEPFLIAMRRSGQLCKIGETPDGGIYAITEKGKREYEGRKRYAGSV